MPASSDQIIKKTYVIEHWVLTLVLAPFVSQAIEHIFGRYPDQVVDLLEVYPISVIFSAFFSLPTFLIYLTCFYFLSKHHVKWPISKPILIAIPIIGIYITQTIIKGSMSKDIIIAYSLTAFIVGLILRLKDNKIKTIDNPIKA